MIENESLSPASQEMQQQMQHVFSTLNVPFVNKESIKTFSEEHNVKFCSVDCVKEAKSQLLPLLSLIHPMNQSFLESKQLTTAGKKTFGLMSRLLARATLDPSLVLRTMSTFVVSKYLSERISTKPSEVYQLLLKLFPQHQLWFTHEIYSRFISAIDLNSFEYTIFPSSLAVQTSGPDQENLQFRLTPVVAKDKLVTVTSLCALGSMINHSCDPNIIIRLPFSREMHWIAAKDIAEGEELLTSYLGDTDADTTQRKQSLSNLYEFECNCVVCTAAQPATTS